ncbi:MAG: hypothetical protein QOE14_1088, partial [Humisphaera sp.]|nr:hypothetical protein [Humisphaera sp.]
ETGEALDNCQHVLLGCCTNLIDFYRRIGASSLIRFDRTIHFRDGVGRRSDLSGISWLPAPLHLGPSLLQFSALTLAEKVQLSRAMLAMLRLGRRGRLALADVPFGDWLDAQDQSPELVRKLYDPVLISALNEETRRASAAYAIQVFQDSLLANSAGYVVGVPSGPLGELYRSLPCRDVRLGSRVTEIVFDAHRATGVRLQNGNLIAADAVVLATTRYAIPRWIPQPWIASDARFRGLDRLEDVPILGAHLWFDRPVMTEPHVAFIDGPLQWIFRKDAHGSAVHGVISAARAWVDVPKDEMLRQFEAQVRRMLPAAAGATLERSRIIIEKRATFSPSPGVDRFRPAQAPQGVGAIPNLILAGDYTQTGWPATMEGAVRSGYLAAEALCRGKSFLVDDLPVQWSAASLGLDD